MKYAMAARSRFWAAVPLALLLSVPDMGSSQAPTSPPPPAAAGPRRQGGFVPGQKRAPENPAQVSRGKTLFEINCRSCHGPDLRGGDMGGPNLLRSPVALSDQHGELIEPIIHGSRQKMGMPAIGINMDDAMAVAAYVRTVIAGIGTQGVPPSEGHEDPSILVGDAKEGKVYFDSKCSGCHSVTNDLKGIATRIEDQKKLQTTWVAGGRERGEESPDRTPKADLTLPSGEQVSGEVTHLDEFLVTLKLPDGSQRSFVRANSATPKIDLHDPLQKHRDLLSEYTDKDIHDVTAYLETMK